MAIPTTLPIQYQCGHTEQRDLADVPAGKRKARARFYGEKYDRAESAALLLETLEAGTPEAAALADNAVSTPYDPAMVDGLLRYDALRQPTQRAWLRAAAAVARGL